jgi:hypothetical protein
LLLYDFNGLEISGVVCFKQNVRPFFDEPYRLILIPGINRLTCKLQLNLPYNDRRGSVADRLHGLRELAAHWRVRAVAPPGNKQLAD